MQHHFPRRGTNQQRGPKRQEHEDHQQVRTARWQVSQDPGHRIGQYNAADGNDHRHKHGPFEQRNIDLLIFRTGLGSVSALLHIDGIQEISICVFRAISLDSSPGGDFAPPIVKVDKLGLERATVCQIPFFDFSP